MGSRDSFVSRALKDSRDGADTILSSRLFQSCVVLTKRNFCSFLYSPEELGSILNYTAGVSRQCSCQQSPVVVALL